ncbi:hypothetical protein ACOMHN_004694 [Nucella lapillus]
MATAKEATEMTAIRTPDTEAEKTPEEDTNQNSDPTVPEEEETGGKEEVEPEEESPPLTYIDFLPQCFGPRLAGCDPTYATFQSVVEQANQWLRTTLQFSVVKCETVNYKLNPSDFRLEPDFCMQHFSSHGKNNYVRGLRLWLMPRTDQSVPTQQLGYITVLPDHSSGNLVRALLDIQPAAMRGVAHEQLFKEFDSLTVTMEKLNHHLQQKPLPGGILTVETLCLKAAESDRTEKFNTENTFWTECGKSTRLFLFATRIFYVVGTPAFEKLCYNDEIPDVLQYPEDFGLRIKFAPFSQTVSRAATWLTGKKNMRVVNFHSMTLKMEKTGGGVTFRTNPESAGFTEFQGLQESRYMKILRVFYVQNHKVADTPALHQSVRLTTRLFVPTKTAEGFETFSKTMERIIIWLNATGAPVLGMETVRYPVNPESDQGVSSERVDSVVSGYSGHYSLACVRLYFPCEFQEPPPEVVPATEEDQWGWACIIS